MYLLDVISVDLFYTFYTYYYTILVEGEEASSAMTDNKVTLSIGAPSLVLLVDVEMMNNKDIVVYGLEEEALLIGKTNMTTITGNRKNNNVLQSSGSWLPR